MNSRSREAQKKDNKQTPSDNAGYLLSRLLFLSFIWTFFSRIMQSLGILPMHTITGSSSSRTIANRLSGNTYMDDETIARLTANRQTTTSTQQTTTTPVKRETADVALPNHTEIEKETDRSVVAPKF